MSNMVQNGLNYITRSAAQMAVGLADEGFKKGTKKFGKAVDDAIEGAVKQMSGPSLHSNQAINKATSLGQGYGMFDVVNGIKHKSTIMDDVLDDTGKVLKKAGDKDYIQGLKAGMKDAYTHDDGSLNMKNIAGSYLTVSAAGRFATGGGIYRNKDGQTDFMGIPLL